MDLLKERDAYLASIRSGDLWTRRKETERRMLTSTDIDALRDELDARDVQPVVDIFSVFWKGVVFGLIGGAFVAACLFGRR